MGGDVLLEYDTALIIVVGGVDAIGGRPTQGSCVKMRTELS